MKKAASAPEKAAKKVPVKKAAPDAPVKTVKKAVTKKALAETPVKTVKKAAVKKAVATKKAAPAPVKAEKKVAVKKAVAAVAAPAKKVAVKKAAPVPVKAEKKVALKKAVAAVAVPVKKTVKKREESLKKLRLSKADKKFFYDLLIHTRASFGQQVQFHSEDALSSRRDSAGERAGMATHMADLGTDNYRHDFELGLMSEEVDVLEMIDEALQRLEDSEYGICLDCGEQIPRKRLEAKPYAKYCVKCKSRREQMDDHYHRR
ncbi:MAG: TraR/DksA C4-type zinc finger protein [Lentisphaeria bacterium]|nr:TraR/DksA C4-type zinc finger protein [Lentisphaeria bacterium]